jgi:hypothetical protein
MKSKIRFLGFVVLVLVIGWGAPASGETYCNYYDHSGTWSDVNKTWVDDTHMCWAATASNILAWGGWGTAAYITADQIYNYIKSYYSDMGGDPYMAYNFWFSGSHGGGGFYPGYRLIDYYHSGALMQDLSTFLHDGYGCHLSIQHYGVAHAITVWGYEYDPTYTPDDYRYYTGLYITNSDDGETRLQQFAIRRDDAGRWFFNEGRLADWQITGCTSLERDPYITLPSGFFWVGKEAMEGLYDLMFYLSFDLKWEPPFPDPQPGDPCKFLVQIETKDGWQTLFELIMEQDEIDWQSLNIEICKDFMGLQKLRFLVLGDAQVCLYRLHPVPLPGALWLLGTGLLGLVGWRRSRKS